MNGDDDIFGDALSLPAAERAAFLTTACQGDTTQRARVDALLRGYDRAQGVLNAPFAPRAAMVPEEKPGDLIGRYKLLQKIGEGGMGVVYLAEQTEPVRRRVALKIIKLGMDTKAVVARFEAERQALAMMDHPNIARVLDGGATDAGRPYFVMELVRGVRITAYCDEARLSTRERLDLFIPVCQAIQHAHQKGIIHRDIKPSNILVTVNDGIAVPKVIDFGIAKATEGRLTDKTILTQFEALIGTPTYMSPEQTVLTSVDIDTRCDIYSLGVLLYELLAGRTPFDAKDLLGAGVDEMRKTIREKDPLRPSARIATLQGEELDATAKRRSVDTSKLLHQLHGDLDWIVMKCLEKDRSRRYATANGLAADLKRHLSNEPVVACPPSAVYRFRKTVRRNKLVFVAAGTVTLTLIAGLSLSTWSFLRERRARADEAAQRIKANAENITSQRHLYAANMNLVQQAWEKNDLGRLRQLLKETRDYPGRGFEWYYWQRQARLALISFDHGDRSLQAVAYSPNGGSIVTAGADRIARVWDAATGSQLFALQGHTGAVNAVAFSPDGGRIATGSKDETVKVWDATSGRPLFTLSGHRGPVSAVAYALDGRRIVTGSEDATAKVWNASGGPALLTLEGHDAPIWSVAFSPDNERIVTGGGVPIGRGVQPAADQDLAKVMTKVWNASDGTELFTLRGHTRTIRSLAVSPNGRWIVTGSGDGTAKVWDAASGQEQRTLTGHAHQVWGVAFSHDSQWIATASVDKTAKVYDANTAQEQYTLKGHLGYVLAVAFSPDGQRLLTGSVDGAAKLWDATSGRGTTQLQGHGAAIGTVAFSTDGRWIVTGSNDWTAKVWEAASGRDKFTIKGHGARIASAAFSPDGRSIVTGSYDNTAKLWDAAHGAEKLTFVGHKAPILSVAFSPDGRRIVTGSSDKTIKIWDTAIGGTVFTLHGHTAPVTSVAYSPDGRHVVSGSDDKLAKLWSAATGRESLNLDGHSSTILSVAFSPGGESIVTGGSDRTAKVWATASGQERFTIKGHTAPITSLAYSPDGQRIVTGSDDSSARVWEAISGQELLILRGQTDHVEAVAFSPDGRRIVTGNENRTANVWQAATPEQVKAWEEYDDALEEYHASLRQQRTEKANLQRIALAGDAGAIKQWLVLAPIPMPADYTYTGGFLAGLDTEHIKGEGHLMPRAGQKSALVSGDLTWQVFAQEDHTIDFIALVGRVTARSAAYAVCYIRSETEQPGLRLLVGSAGGTKIYLNAKQVHEYRFERGFSADLDQHTVTDITLNAGLNVLWFKVVINAGALRWQNSVRFTDAQGQPVKGITVTLSP